YTVFFPLYASDIGLSATLIGIVISVHTLAAIIIRIYMVSLMDKFKIIFIIKISLVISAITFILFPFVKSFILLTVLSLILGLGLGLGQPLSISMTIDALEQNQIGSGLGVRITFNRLTQFLTPILFGGVASFVSN